MQHQASALFSTVQFCEAPSRRHCCSQALTLRLWPRCCSILVAWRTCWIVEDAEEGQACATTCCHSSFATCCFRGTPACFRGTPRWCNTSIKFELPFRLHVLLCMTTSSSCSSAVCLLLHLCKTASLCAQQLVCVHVQCSTY